MTILLSIFPPQHRHALYDLALMTNLQDTNQPHQHQRPPNSSTIYKTTKPVYTFPNLYSYAYKYCYNYNIISTQAVLATSIGQLKTARCVLWITPFSRIKINNTNTEINTDIGNNHTACRGVAISMFMYHLQSPRLSQFVINLLPLVDQVTKT